MWTLHFPLPGGSTFHATTTLSLAFDVENFPCLHIFDLENFPYFLQVFDVVGAGGVISRSCPGVLYIVEPVC